MASVIRHGGAGLRAIREVEVSRQLVAIVITSVLAAPVLAGSETASGAQKHPGAMGFERSGYVGGGIPTSVWGRCVEDEDGGCPAVLPAYDQGPGGWGDWVSDCAVAEVGFDPESCSGSILP